MELAAKEYALRIQSARSGGEFAHLGDQVYLDHAANTIYAASLIEDYKQKLTDPSNWSLFSNPHSQSQSAQYTRAYIKMIREKILSKLFNTSSSQYDIVFVQNATYGLKLLAESFQFETELDDSSNSDTTGSCFAYLNDNHTSVIGMREIVWSRYPSTEVYCVMEPRGSEELESIKLNSSKSTDVKAGHYKHNSLFVYPAQSNFNGRRYKDLERRLTKRDWYVCVDTASFVSTSPMDLSVWQPDFLSLSFYKMFGFPTGLGALLVKKTAQSLLESSYFGGGTVEMALISENVVKMKEREWHAKFEPGTISYLDIIAVNTAIDKFDQLTFGLGFSLISQHLSMLTHYFYQRLKELKHFNGQRLVELYRNHETERDSYGPIFAFNLKTARSKYISFVLVDKLAQSKQIHLRVGCFCNIGACQSSLEHLNNSAMIKNYSLYQHKCGDHIDLIDSKPTGCIRVSFGYCTTQSDLDYFLDFLSDSFLETTEPYALNEDGNRSGREAVTFYKVKSILIYPIKSCLPMLIEDSWPIDQTVGGLLFDRSWILVDENSVALSQKRNSQFLTQLKPIINLATNQMELVYNNTHSFKLDLLLTNKKLVRQLNMNNKLVECVDEGDEVSDWLSDVFGKRSRLYRIIEEKEEMKSFSNQANYLLINQTSVAKLRKFLETNGSNDRSELIDFYLSTQFRPNIIVESLNEDLRSESEFEEETWSGSIQVLNKNLEFQVQEACTRCQMINIDQKITQQHDDYVNYSANLLKQLFKMRSSSKFGIYLKLRPDSSSQTLDKLTTGDIFRVTSI